MFLDSISMAGDGHISMWQVINCVVEEEICVRMYVYRKIIKGAYSFIFICPHQEHKLPNCQTHCYLFTIMAILQVNSINSVN